MNEKNFSIRFIEKFYKKLAKYKGLTIFFLPFISLETHLVSKLSSRFLIHFLNCFDANKGKNNSGN